MTSVYQEAKTLLLQTKKLKREEDPEVRTRSGTTVAQSHHSTSGPLFFEPSKTHIKDISEIHPVLLQDVVNCYKKYKYVCRICFIRYNRQEIVVGGKPCKRCKNTATVRIMPASKLCKNFRDLKILAIPPPPKVLMAPTNLHKPFLYCRNSDHLLCYDRAKESWYGHSVEELVVWTIERYFDCSFTEYVAKHHVEVASQVEDLSKDAPDQKTMDNLDTFSDEQEDYEFYPNEASFLPRGLANIPKHLLEDVIKCYAERREYCKTCFYKMGRKGELSVGPQNTSVCKLCRRPWQRVVVMPSSRLCWNFGDFDVIPVAPLPRAKTMSLYSTFRYCINDNHYRCFKVYIDNEFWYAHSVEELVIWTVEKEKDCSFTQFINKGRKPALSPPGLTLPTSPPPSQNHTPTATTTTTTSSSATMTSSTTQSTTTVSSTADSDPPESATLKGQSAGKIGSSTPSFSQVVVSGPPVKIRPPPSGKPKTTGSEREKELQPAQISVDVDAVSVNSNSSGFDSRVTGLMNVSSPPPATAAAAAARAISPVGGVTLESPTQPGSGGANHPTKMRHHSESSYMTALSQDSVSSNGNEELSQESVHSAPVKPRTSEASSTPGRTTAAGPGKPKTAVKSNATRSRPNYKVMKPVKMAKSSGGGGKVRKELRSTDRVTNEVDDPGVDEREDQPEANLTSSEVSNTEFESSTQCASDTGLSQPSDHIFSPSHTPVVNNSDYSLSSVGKEGGNLTIKSSLPNGRFGTTNSTHNTGFPTGFTAGYRPSRPPGYTNSTTGFSSHRENLVSPNHQGFPTAYGATTAHTNEVYKFNLVTFRALSDVPLPLISAIAPSYARQSEVCRKCFFGERSLCREEGGVCGECAQPWENPVTVIPGCKECNNEPCFDSDDYVPLHPLPPVAIIRRCSLKNHHKCFQKSLESNPKFAHSIQQLVVWLIESEKDCTFEEFINGELKMLVHLPRPDSTSHHAPAGVAGLRSREYSGGANPVAQLHHTSTAPQGFVASTGTGINASPSPTDLKPPHTTAAATVTTNSPLRPLTPKYNAKNVGYEYIDVIPGDLLAAVALCYQSLQVACRQCFLTGGSCQVTTAKRKSSSSSSSSDTCSEGHAWRPLTVIPGCRLCTHGRNNPGYHVPVLPVPRHMKGSPAQFCICKKNNHGQCYKLTTNPWFPHSVEELVIWTIERERSVSYETVYKSYLPGPEWSHLTPETVLLLPPSPSSSASSLTQTSAGSKSGRGRSPSRTGSSSFASRSESDTASSRATVVAHSERVSPATTAREEAGTSGNKVPKHSSSSSRAHRNSQSASSGNGAKGGGHQSDVAASLTSGGGESSDTGSVPGSSESLQSSLTEITSENPFPEALQQPQPASSQQPPPQVVGVAEQNGLPSAPVSLFHDPLIYYGSSTNAALQSSDSTAPPFDVSDSDDFTLDFFPALRQNAGGTGDVGKQNPNPGLLSPVSGNETAVNADVDLSSVQDIVDDQNSGTTSSEAQTESEESAAGPETNGKAPDALIQQTLKDEELLHAEHNRYRSRKSSARPENWPDVQQQSSTIKDSSTIDGQVVVDSDNHQGHGESPPCSSLGSSSGFVVDGAEENTAKEGGGAKSNDLAAKTDDSTGINSKSTTAVNETTGAQSTADKPPTEQQNVEPTSSSSSSENNPTATSTGNSRPGSTPQTPLDAGTPLTPPRRESLDVNAKEFTPRVALLRSDSRPNAYPTGLNPNAAAVYPYITNGGVPVLTPVPVLTTVPPMMVNPLPTVTGVMSGGPLSSATRRKMKGPAQPMVDPSSTSNTIPYPTSEISSSPTSSLSPPHSPTRPHKCFLCYLSFPDPQSLRRHCKTAAHISTLMRDCGASTIWKNLPPPPGQPRELMKLCVNGYSCTLSRLVCIQPHFADEFAEQLRRVEHHNKREATRNPLPLFSDQQDGLLISPIERVTQYTTLRVSVKEPLKAILTDASASFTWTISVQGQHWQTLFGIHLKSQNPVFQITDLEDANALVEGKCQSDRANWVASSPADAILLGRLCFSVRASPENVNGNFDCRVCLNLGFYQHAYISLALVVNGVFWYFS
jgi:hypothetical protein